MFGWQSHLTYLEVVLGRGDNFQNSGLRQRYTYGFEMPAVGCTGDQSPRNLPLTGDCLPNC